MSTKRNIVSGLSKNELLDILNDIDSKQEQDRTNISDHQKEKGQKSKKSKSWRLS